MDVAERLIDFNWTEWDAIRTSLAMSMAFAPDSARRGFLGDIFRKINSSLREEDHAYTEIRGQVRVGDFGSKHAAREPLWREAPGRQAAPTAPGMYPGQENRAAVSGALDQLPERSDTRPTEDKENPGGTNEDLLKEPWRTIREIRIKLL